MGPLTITEVMTLDGVAQAPGPPEDVFVATVRRADLIGVARSVLHVHGVIR